MSGNVRRFTLAYNAINSSNTFTSGDCVTGKITFELLKDCKIKSLSVKLEGKAEVQWNKSHGDGAKSYQSKRQYFTIKEVIIQKGHGTNIVPRGSKVYPFSLQIPAEDLPSSFMCKWGKIEYKLKANLRRSMKKDEKAEAYLTFVHNVDPRSDPVLMTPQRIVREKKMLFTSGRVSMDVHIERMAFYQGEGIKVVASVQNRSSQDIKPKYCLYMKQSFFSKGEKWVNTKDVLKEVGDALPPSTSPTVTRILTIPPDVEASILNCEIIKLEHRLKVYLDIKYAENPEIKFPIVILPALKAPEEPPPPYETYRLYPLTNFSGKY